MNFDELKMKLPNDLYHLQVIANFVQQWPEVRI
jgi:hypothetical protein